MRISPNKQCRITRDSGGTQDPREGWSSEIFLCRSQPALQRTPYTLYICVEIFVSIKKIRYSFFLARPFSFDNFAPSASPSAESNRRRFRATSKVHFSRKLKQDFCHTFLLSFPFFFTKTYGSSSSSFWRFCMHPIIFPRCDAIFKARFTS